MSVTSNLRDKQALVLRLIVAEVLAKPGEGPLAPRFRLPFRSARPSGALAQPREPEEQKDPEEPAP